MLKPLCEVDIEVDSAAGCSVAIATAILHSCIHSRFARDEHDAQHVCSIILSSGTVV
jgi:hypothetical protein